MESIARETTERTQTNGDEITGVMGETKRKSELLLQLKENENHNIWYPSQGVKVIEKVNNNDKLLDKTH